MITLEINDTEVSVKKGTTLLEAAKKLGIYIPTLCYDRGISPYGACRLCVVEIGERPKTRLVSSCTYPAEKGLIVQTESPRITRARKMIIERYLSIAPDFQAVRDLAVKYGVTRQRFRQKHEDCILCGQCVRKSKEQKLGRVIAFRGRGEHRSIGVPYGSGTATARPCGVQDLDKERRELEDLSRKKFDIFELLSFDSDKLFTIANMVRNDVCGDEVHIRGIIEYSNICSRNCNYGVFRRDNKSISRFALKPDEIMQIVSHAETHGIKTIMLQSGENDKESPEFLTGVIARIKKDFNVAVTLSVGVKPFEYYKMWRQAGADRYLIKHETANPELYRKYHPDSKLKDRVKAIFALKDLGYEVGTGAIVGLPGQTIRDLAMDILLAEHLDVDQVVFGPLVTHSNTPLGKAKDGDLELSLRILAVARIILRSVHLPSITAFEAISSGGRIKALHAGANEFTVNLTPELLGRFWDVYPRNYSVNLPKKAKEIIFRVGRTVAKNSGRSLNRRQEPVSCSGNKQICDLISRFTNKVKQDYMESR